MQKVRLIALLVYIQVNVLLEHLALVTVLLEYIDHSFMKSLINSFKILVQ